MPKHETTCETCGGLGREMIAGKLWTCEDCNGEGRVPAVEYYPLGVYTGDLPADTAPELLAIPKEARTPQERSPHAAPEDRDDW